MPAFFPPNTSCAHRQGVALTKCHFDEISATIERDRVLASIAASSTGR
jgi:hypothetical protein